MRIYLLILFVMLLSPAGRCEVSTMELSPGLWEGISEDRLTFKLLEINQNGEHSFFEIVIPGGLKKMRRTAFTNDDISCIENRCTVKTIIEDDINRILT